MSSHIVPAEEAPHLSRDERRKLGQLVRRRNHLGSILADGKSRAPAWDTAEAAALSWAIDRLMKPDSLTAKPPTV